MFFLEESRTVPREPSEVGVYTFRSGRPNAPLLSKENRPFDVNSPSAAEDAVNGGCSVLRGSWYSVDTTKASLDAAVPALSSTTGTACEATVPLFELVPGIGATAPTASA